MGHYAKDKTEILRLRLTKKQLDYLKEVAESRATTVSDVVRQLIEQDIFENEFLLNLED